MAKKKPTVDAIRQAAIVLARGGQWKGRESAVQLGKRFNVSSTIEVLRMCELAISEAVNSRK